MKRIKTRALALLLSCSVLATGIVGGYEKVQAASLSAGAALAGESLNFLESLFMAGGMSLGLDMILKTQNDINNWDWGELLDDPLNQDQLKDAEDKIGKLYYGATEAYKKTHGNGSGTTPSPAPTSSPDISPPVTVAPINPDDLDIPEDWATLKKNATDKGLLAMGAATAYCVKEAVKGWWDDIMKTEEQNVERDNPENPFIGKKYLGSIVTKCANSSGDTETMTTYIYDLSGNIKQLQVNEKEISNGIPFFNLSASGEDEVVGSYYVFNRSWSGVSSGYDSSSIYNYHVWPLISADYHIYVPLVNIDGSVEKEAGQKSLSKTSLWPSVDLKDDYDNNRSPNFPELATPTLRLPSLDEIKDLWKQGSDDEENRPTYVTNFITNHTVQPTPEPKPTKKPEVNPNPGGGTDPDPEPTPSTTPAVVPDPGGGSGGGSGTEKPDNPKPEDEIAPYKADIKKVFPFCIPFDLVHLFEVFDAEPEAPVFTIPIELKVDNPFTGKSIVDYEDSIKIDLSDYEQPIKVIRIFEVIFFLIGLMLITRSHMIKG